ncbi:unnamed protein product [Arabidopsis halleri]
MGQTVNNVEFNKKTSEFLFEKTIETYIQSKSKAIRNEKKKNDAMKNIQKVTHEVMNE